MATRIDISLGVAVAALCALAEPARADLQICSRMSYVVEAAIAVEDDGAAASRGWFRVDPGACRTVLQGAPPGATLYVHARALPVYGGSPLPQGGQADFCVGSGTFVLSAAQRCHGSEQQLARFAAVKPSQTDKGLTVYLAEDAEYDDTQARDAGIQRLLTIAGYDATPIDGIRGFKTDQALVQFIADNGLENTAAGRADFFDTLMAAAQKPNGSGFAWCNETDNPVMAALGVESKGSILTRGWYRVAPRKCLRPDVTGRPHRLYSFGEAIGPNGLAIKDTGGTTSWGGPTVLCTRDSKFEIGDQRDCAASGLTAIGFATVEFAGRSGATVRFK